MRIRLFVKNHIEYFFTVRLYSKYSKANNMILEWKYHFKIKQFCFYAPENPRNTSDRKLKKMAHSPLRQKCDEFFTVNEKFGPTLRSQNNCSKFYSIEPPILL